MTDREVWLERVRSIRPWSRRGERAPHKPLLLLHVLGRLQRTGTSSVSFTEAEPVIDALLREYWVHSSSAAYPFHHLQTDGLWTVDAGGASPGSSRSQLRATGAVGGLVPDLERALLEDPLLLALAAHAILDGSFPESLHADLCRAVGLDLVGLEVAAARDRTLQLRRRDPAFRELVLLAYEQRCAVCGYDGRLGAEAVALDAAHVRWWAFDGPDTIDNGLCLCTIHHQLLDRGVIGITDQHVVTVSAHFVGRGRAAEELVLRLAGQPLLEPQRGYASPARAHVGWHKTQVFREPARLAS